MANNIKFNLLLNANKTLSTFKSIRKQVDITNKRVNLLNKSMGRQVQVQKKVASASRASTTSFRKLTSSFVKGNLIASAISKSFNAVTRGIIDAGLGALKTSANFEKLKVQFGVLTGSTKTANDLFQDLVNFSAKTPFRLNNIAEAGQKLLAFGFSAEEVKVQIRRLGDVAGATGSDLGEVSRIFGQIRSAGRLTGERNLQLLERGIVLYPELAKVMGVPEQALEKLQKQGKITFEQVNQAVQNLTSKGGRFFEGTIKLAKTAAGVWSTVRDNLDILGATLGNKLLPFLKFAGIAIIKIVGNATKWIEANLTLAKTFQFVTTGIEFFVAMINTTLRAFEFMRKGLVVIQGLFEGFALLLIKTFGPALRVFSTGIGFFAEKLGFSKSAFDGFNKSLEDLEKIKFGTVLDDTTSKIEAIGNATDSTVAKVKAGAAQLTTDLAGFVFDQGGGIDNPITTGGSGEGGDKEPNAALKKQLEERMNLLRAAQLAETELEVAKEIENGERNTFTLQKLIEQLGAEEAIKFEARLRNVESVRETENIMLEVRAAAATSEIQNRADTNKFLIELEQELADKKRKIREQELKDREANNQAALRGTASMFGGLAQLTALGGKKQFKITKALNIAQATTTGILAIQNAVASAPPPFNIPAIVGTTAVTAANIARIAATKPPTFAEGGIVPGSSFSGDTNLVRTNSEEMILNRAQQATLFNQINTGSGGASSQNITVEIDGEAIATAVSKQVANGVNLGEIV